MIETTAPPNLNVYGLLVIDQAASTFPNLRRSADPVTTYVRCAALMAKSALAAGHRVTIVTNRPDLVGAHFALLGVPEACRIEERQFVSRLPVDADHRSAHHKLDLIRLLAERDDGLCAIVDLDALFVGPTAARQLPSGDQLGVYDITGDMERESDGRAASDVVRLAGTSVRDPRWFGGEIIVGGRSAFAALAGSLGPIEQAYYQDLGDFYHVGDETIVSTALNLLLEDGLQVRELGGSDTVQRWWSSRRPHPQRSLTSALSASILHLPADKEFLASQAAGPFDAASFRKQLRTYAKRKILSRQLSNLAHRLKPGSPALIAPRF